MVSKIKKVLVANRGEIALRVMRSLREMGIQTVAIYSEADRISPHVRFADEAVCIGPPPSAQSYLQGDKIIEICKKLNVDAIHPGYGFLSENPVFAKAVEDAGLIFIGPGHEAIRIMGNKLEAKEAVKKFDIPMVPGTDYAIKDLNQGLKIATEIGFPVLIKAAAGGGGKGMRVVNDEKEFAEQMNRAVSEAQSAFGDGSVFIEKFVTSPRHIEIQILADKHGNIIHLFERECSIQRRHQKVIEEAPSGILTPELREKMGNSAVQVARAVNYVGAGTVEFLVDENLNYYFLEMNTRLQVEHPVTEMITNTDLVKEMVYIAEGKPLSIRQEDLKINGHAIEVRVYAEDPANNFLPSTGRLVTYQPPKGIGVRVDDGYEEGMTIPIYYDPMISKLITHGENRLQAIDRMIRAIDEYKISGVKTTLPFCRFVMNHEAFRTAQFDTKFVEKYFTPDVKKKKKEDEMEVAALFAAWSYQENKTKNTLRRGIQTKNGSMSKWRIMRRNGNH